jgi:uncharacterized OB-fold protein
VLTACAVGVFAFLIISMTGGMAADQKANHAKTAAAAVEFVNPDEGTILLSVDKNWKISGIDHGDEVEIVIEEETEATQDQQPRRWRLQRIPPTGPTHP